MKTIKTIIKETVNKELDRRGLLVGDLAQVLSENIWTAIQERKHQDNTCPAEWMNALYLKTGIDPFTASIGMRQQLSDCGKALIQSGAELADLDAFILWWKSFTRAWSIDVSFPTPKQIRDNWGKFKTGANHKTPLVVK